MIELRCTCSACPTQYEGTADGLDFEFRYRHGRWTVRIDGDEIVSGDFYGSGGSDGVMSERGVRALVRAAATLRLER